MATTPIQGDNNMTTTNNTHAIGDQITFLQYGAFGDNEITGTIIELNITSIDGFEIAEYEMPCHVVLTEDECVWAVPAEWMI
jgi:hypothetical protein